MKNVTGGVTSAEPISLSRAAKILSGFVSSKNGASQDISAYLRRASAAFIDLKSIHREIKSSTKPSSEARQERNRTGDVEKLGGAKGVDNLVETGGKIGLRKIETVSDDESIYAQEQDEVKEGKQKKKRKKKEEGVVVDKLEKDSRNKEKKKKKNGGEMASEDKKSKKRKKSKEIDG